MDIFLLSIQSLVPTRYLIATMIVVLMMTVTFLICPFVLEEAYDEIIGTASFFQEETNNGHLDGRHNIRLNADGSTVVGTPSQPPPTVSAPSSRLTHSICT